MPLLDPHISAKIGMLQSLDDAIAFRVSRLNLPCPDCTADRRCTDHACDLDLIAGYRDRYAAAFTDAVADMDADDIGQIMQPGDGTPPTAGLLSAAMLKQLRELAADGPAITQLDGHPVMIELEGVFEVSRGRLSGWSPGVTAGLVRSVLAACPGCRPCGRGGAGSRGCG